MGAFQPTLDHLDGVPISLQVVAGALIFGVIYASISGKRPFAGLPLVTIKHKGWRKLLPRKFTWIFQSDQILAKGARECPSVYQVETGSGYKLVVPNRFADELKNHSSLNFNEAFAQELFVEYPGMDGVRQGTKDDTFIQEIVRVKLTQSLGLITDDLVDECTESVHEFLGEDSEWKTVPIKQHFLNIVARLSSRVFLGIPLCRNKEWLAISKDYTVDSFMAANKLRLCPALLRPILFWTIPCCRRIVSQVRQARQLIQPEVDRRCKNAKECLANGENPSKRADTIGWMVEVAKGRQIDYVAAQLALTTAAIHTTSETTSKCVMALCDNPEIIAPLREELIQVLSEGGWTKTTLYKMKLLDSFLKEVQRIDGLSTTTLNRLVKQPVKLSDGTVIPAGARVMVANDRVMNPNNYPEPKKFQVDRFLKLRSRPGEENRHQFVTTTTDHMAFGHGQHACPGRFFASNEMKIMLSFLLIRYDVRYVPGEKRPESSNFETAKSVHPNLRVQIRRRREEIDLLDPQMGN